MTEVENKRNAEEVIPLNEPGTAPHTRGRDDHDFSTRCGLGKWRPAFLQVFANMGCFTGVLTLSTAWFHVAGAYHSIVLTQIEKRFGLSSFQSGFIKNGSLIGTILCSIIVGHFCRYSNKPRIFALALFLTTVCLVIFISPEWFPSQTKTRPEHLLIAINGSTSPQNSSSYSSSALDASHHFCQEPEASESVGGECIEGAQGWWSFDQRAFAVFVMVVILTGAVRSPFTTLGITYMDDNSSNSVKYFGVMFALSAIFPLLGTLIGSWAVSIPHDLKETTLTQMDPRWVGAWWLGFAIVAAILALWSIPMLLFPSRMVHAQPEVSNSVAAPSSGDDVTSRPTSVLGRTKDLPAAFWRLLTNPIYMSLLISACASSVFVQYFVFLPKYLVLYYQLTPSAVGIILGVVGCISGVVGPLLSSFVLARRKFSFAHVLGCLTLIQVVAIICILAHMFLSCDEGVWAGTDDQWNSVDNSLNYTCNSSLSCSCRDDTYQPVCAGAKVNFLSPCHAGCTGVLQANDTQMVFTGCSCSPDDTVTSGTCARKCGKLPAFVAILVTYVLLESVTAIPYLAILLKCVDDQDKALSLSLFMSVASIFGFPVVLLYGAIIDSTCVMKISTCLGQGACALYDLGSFRLRLHGIALVGIILITLTLTMSWLATRMDRYKGAFIGETKEKKRKEANRLDDADVNKNLTLDT